MDGSFLTYVFSISSNQFHIIYFRISKRIVSFT